MCPNFYAESGSENPQLERVILKLRHGLELEFSFRVRVKLVVMVMFIGMSWDLHYSSPHDDSNVRICVTCHFGHFL